jgi:hypothetical protein
VDWLGLKRLKARLGPKTAAEGVVTLADANYFPGVAMLCRSIQGSGYPVPVVCFDVGLTEEQRAWGRQHLPALQIRDLPPDRDIALIRQAPEDPALAKPGKRHWPLWICPFLIAASPFRRTFWIDADVVVLRDLEGLFRLLDSGPLFTPENLAPQATPNKPELYELLPIARSFDPARPALNGGVSGWDLERDEAVLRSYMYPIRRAFEDPAIKAAISWHDQGALIWAVQRHGLEDRVAPTTAWNRCVIHTPAFHQAFPWDPAGLEQLRDRVPDVNLLHWNGVRVPWSGNHAVIS